MNDKDPRTPLDQCGTDELAERLTAARKDVGRELGVRKSVYSRWVAQKRLDRETAISQYFAMSDAYGFLKALERDRDEIQARLRADERTLWRSIEGDVLFIKANVTVPEDLEMIFERIQETIARGKGEATE